MWPFGAKSQSLPTGLNHSRILELISDALERPSVLGSIRSKRLLGLPKSLAKEALIELMKAASTAEARQVLRAAYLSVGEFRDLTVEEQRALAAYSNLLSEASDEHLRSLMQDQPEVHFAMLELVTNMNRLIAEECEADKAELERLGLLE